MAFTRRTLAGYGLTDEQLEKVMTLHATSLADYVPKSDVQEQISQAVADAQKNAPAPDIKGSEDYKALQQEFDGYKRKVETSAQLKKGGVKEKFLDNVYALLEDGKPAEEQLAAIKEKYAEYFTESTQPTTPQFGAEVRGQMPSGRTGTTIEEVWGLGKK